MVRDILQCNPDTEICTKVGDPFPPTAGARPAAGHEATPILLVISMRRRGELCAFRSCALKGDCVPFLALVKYVQKMQCLLLTDRGQVVPPEFIPAHMVWGADPFPSEDPASGHWFPEQALHPFYSNPWTVTLDET